MAFFFLALLIVLLTKNLPYLKSLVDIHWHMAFLDYDVTWRTPLFSLAGNILYHFDMQVPFNTNLAPLNGAVRLFAPEHRIAASFTLVSLGTGVLLWFIGWTAGLRPVACTIFAGLTALIVTVPFGFDHLLPFLPPPFLFMSQAMLTTYWGEVGVLSLTTVLLFFWVGQCSSVAANVAISVVFTASCYLGLLAYPATAFFSLLVVAFLLPGVPGNDDGECQGILVEDYRQHCCIGLDAGNAHAIVLQEPLFVFAWRILFRQDHEQQPNSTSGRTRQ